MLQRYILNQDRDVIDNKESSTKDQQNIGSQDTQNYDEPPNVSFLNHESNRLAAFESWTVPFIDKKLLARTGFYYIGPNDLVKCFYCKVEIGMWEPDDNVINEHLKWSPSCRLISGRETENIPIDTNAFRQVLPQISYDTCGIRDVRSSAIVESSSITSQSSIESTEQTETNHSNNLLVINRPEHSEFKLESTRLRSFLDWPKTMKQRPKNLAEAGFFYTGKGDRVICFSCGGGLKLWDETDDPWEQHAMWYEKCDYLKLMKGQEFIKEVTAKNKSEVNKNMENTEDVENTEDKKEVMQPDKDNNVSNGCKKPILDSRLCKICYENEYNTAFLPCGHIIACAKCASSVTTCPYCRQPFTSIMRVYLS